MRPWLALNATVRRALYVMSYSCRPSAHHPGVVDLVLFHQHPEIRKAKHVCKNSNWICLRHTFNVAAQSGAQRGYCSSPEKLHLPFGLWMPRNPDHPWATRTCRLDRCWSRQDRQVQSQHCAADGQEPASRVCFKCQQSKQTREASMISLTWGRSKLTRGKKKKKLRASDPRWMPTRTIQRCFYKLLPCGVPWSQVLW